MIFRFKYVLLLSAIALVGSCVKPPDYSETPSITFKSISKPVVLEATDSLLLTFSFTDGDGNLGALNDEDTVSNIFLVDSRDNSIKRYRIPNLTPDGNVKAISGDVNIIIRPFTCSAGVDEDQLTYKITVKDRTLNESNSITTDPITIDCQ